MCCCDVFVLFCLDFSLVLFSLSAATAPAVPAQYNFKGHVPAFAIYFVRMFRLVLFVFLCVLNMCCCAKGRHKCCVFAFLFLFICLDCCSPVSRSKFKGRAPCVLLVFCYSCVCLINCVWFIFVFLHKGPPHVYMCLTWSHPKHSPAGLIETCSLVNCKMH